MRETDDRDEASEARATEPGSKRPWTPPRIEDLPPLTHLALGTPIDGGGGLRDRVF